MTIATRAMTLEQFLRLPEREPPLEYEDGEVTQKVSPKLGHARLQAKLAVYFERLLGSDEAIWVLTEARATFGGQSVVPDVSLYRRERLPVDADGDADEDLTIPPDLAVEIVSPKQSVSALHRRCLWYVANGVGVALLVDRADRSVFVFRPGGRATALRGDDAIELEELLPGFRLTVRELFASLRLR